VIKSAFVKVAGTGPTHLRVKSVMKRISLGRDERARRDDGAAGWLLGSDEGGDTHGDKEHCSNGRSNPAHDFHVDLLV
jgi:hypothetical protein